MGETVRLGMLGSGFIADFYMAGLRDVPEARVTAAYSRSAARAADFARRHGVARTHDGVDALCADPDVDLVVVCLPNHRHLEAVRATAAAGKGILCTKPLGRNGAEAAEMVRAVRAAGVFAGYLENVVFAPDVMKARAMVASGALGDFLSMRAREGHSGPHAPHFWDAETAGGGALLDMGCHCIEAIRYVRGKEHRIVDVFAWGATLAHGARTTGEDTAIAILRFADGRTATVEAAWTTKGGMEVRNEVYGTKGRIVHDTSATSLRAFIEEPAGYLVEKADAETGWVFPIADEARVYGYDEQFRDMLDAFRAGTAPRETFEDGYVVNCILDAAYRSMTSGRWEPVDVDEEIARA